MIQPLTHHRSGARPRTSLSDRQRAARAPQAPGHQPGDHAPRTVIVTDMTPESCPDWRPVPAAAPQPGDRDSRPEVARAVRAPAAQRGPRPEPRPAGLRDRGGRRRDRGRRRQLADRLRLGHRGHVRRQQRRPSGEPRHRAGRPVHAHLLHGGAVRGLRGGMRAAQPADAGRPREAVGAVQLRRRGRRERRQDRPARDRTGRGRRLRPRLSRPDQPDDGDDRQEHAVQGGLRAVRRRGVPGADGLPVPLARRSGQVRRGGPRGRDRA